MKRIYTLLATALMLAGTALWCGCSNNELLDPTTPETSKQAGSFSFRLKGTGTNTRATQAAESAESEVKTMYAAFFVKNEAEEEANYKLHRIFYYDPTGVPSGWDANLAMTLETGEGVNKYTIDKMQESNTYTGNYVVYFIANPEDAIKTQLKGYLDTDGESRTTLGNFEADLIAKGTAKDDTRGFTMISDKKDIEVSDGARTYDIELVRLAARFDFINSSPANATITSVTFRNSAKQSNFVAKADNTESSWLETPEASTWPTGDPTPTSTTLYTYENLNTANADGTNVDYGYIEVAYTLSATNKTLRIDLKEGDTPLAIMRNHLYKIHLNCISGTYNLTVADWVGGETVTIPNQNLAITYTADSLGKIGDYVYTTTDGKLAFSDGGLRKMYLDGTLEWIWDQDPSKEAPDLLAGERCVGMVFSNAVSADDAAAGYAGYVVGYTPIFAGNYGNNYWSTTSGGPVSGFSFKTTVKALYADMDGLSIFNAIQQTADWKTKYPLFDLVHSQYASKNGGNCNLSLPSDDTTSGWYVPTMGQLLLWIKNIVNVDVNWMSNSNTSANNSIDLGITTAKFAQNVTKRYKKIPNYYSFDGNWYATASEINTTQISSIIMSGNVSLVKYGKDAKPGIIPVFAFKR